MRFLLFPNIRIISLSVRISRISVARVALGCARRLSCAWLLMSLPVSAGLAALFACLFVCLFAHGCYGPSPKHCHGTAEGVLPGAVGQKRLFCPTKSRFSEFGWAKVLVLPNGRSFFRARMGKNACFAQRRAVFSGADGQKCRFCPTKGCFSGFGWAKRPVLPNGELGFPLW